MGEGGNQNKLISAVGDVWTALVRLDHMAERGAGAPADIEKERERFMGAVDALRSQIVESDETAGIRLQLRLLAERQQEPGFEPTSSEIIGHLGAVVYPMSVAPWLPQDEDGTE